MSSNVLQLQNTLFIYLFFFFGESKKKMPDRPIDAIWFQFRLFNLLHTISIYPDNGSVRN